HVDTKAAAFALAERLTGVRVTEELLQGAEYQSLRPVRSGAPPPRRSIRRP
ncbi:DUF6461 domain-containing protein, partial [Streptomyces sp. NPDC051642]|uniref:DUF6461 domain-containing protein n=1 Tax=Streptomyces sp. NPDC051642 TaxID=3154646 RepID=UPI003420567E